MPIAVVCSECNTSLSAPDAAAGKNAKCPKCKAALVVPMFVKTDVTLDEDDRPQIKTDVELEEDDDCDFQPRRRKKGMRAVEADAVRSRRKRRHGRDRRRDEAGPETVLRRSDYVAYRNVRIVSFVILLHGLGLSLGCLFAFLPNPETGKVPADALPPAAAAIFGVIGVAGATCGAAVFSGNRKWRPVVYFSAVLYFFALPVGPLFSIMILMNLSRYYESVERLNEANEDG